MFSITMAIRFGVDNLLSLTQAIIRIFCLSVKFSVNFGKIALAEIVGAFFVVFYRYLHFI